MARRSSLEKYHLYVRPNRTARNRIWYAWWWEGEKRISKSTGCRLKSDALREIEEWKAQDRRKESGTLEAFAADFFLPGRCPYIAWKAEQGGIKQHTVYEHRKNLTKKILPALGKRLLADIGPVDVETWLRTLSLSGSAKNGILNTVNILMQEALRARKISQAPRFRRFARRSMQKDILSGAECRVLFPDTEEELAQVWKVAEKDVTGLMFGILFRVMLHAGLRPGEGRALHLEQLYAEHNGILIDRQIDSEDALALPKKSTTADTRRRLVLVPKTTMELLTRWVELAGIGEGYLFLFDGKPIRKEYLKSRFDKGLENAKVRVGERILVPYSLRYTFRSRAEGNLDQRAIMDMMGHRSLEVSDIYLRFDPDQFAALKPYQENIESFW
jgi:integrase